MIRPALLATLGLVLVATPAAADDGAAEEEERISYRGQTLAADAVSLGLMVGGGMLEGGRWNGEAEAMMGFGALGGLVASPLIHGVRGNAGNAIGSFALRVGLMNVGFLVAWKANEGCEEWLCELDNVGLGAFAGLATAAIIDNALFPSETIVRKPARERRPPERVVVPQLAASPGGGMVGVGGTF